MAGVPLSLTLAPFESDGSALMALAETLAPPLADLLSADIRLHPVRLDLMAAYDPARRQYRARRFLEQLEALPGEIVLGLTSLDLFLPVFTFIFGEAMLGGRTAIVSTYRLAAEHYGLSSDAPLLRERLAREAVHEIGHCFGLVHCTDGLCAMAASHNPEMIDTKSADYCAACREQGRKGGHSFNLTLSRESVKLKE
jgi:archaemetzincin